MARLGVDWGEAQTKVLALLEQEVQDTGIPIAQAALKLKNRLQSDPSWAAKFKAWVGG